MRVLVALVLLSSSLAAQDASFRVSANFIKVPVSVFDESGGILSGLERDDFQLFDEESAQPIENFLLDYAPIHVLLLLDTSGSLEQEVAEIRTAALRFAGSFSKEDRLSLISFSDEVLVLRDWTNKYKAIKKGLKKLKPGFRTALYDALRSAVSDQFDGISGRKVIILLTDGLDNASRTTYDGLVDNLTESDITLFIISRTRLVSPQVRDSTRVQFLNKVMKNVLKTDGDYVDIFFKEKETAMRNLAEITGGRVLFPERLEELASTYHEVARQLKQQYVLTFAAPASSDKRFRTIRVLCSEPDSLVHFRRQYAWRP